MTSFYQISRTPASSLFKSAELKNEDIEENNQ